MNAEQQHNRTHIEKAAENAMFKLCARGGMVALTVLIIPLGTSLFSRMVNTMDAILSKLELVSIQVHTNTVDIRHMVENDQEMKRRLVILERDRRSAIESLP